MRSCTANEERAWFFGQPVGSKEVTGWSNTIPDESLSDLGGRWLNVERRDFTRARHIAEKLVTDESLTIRLNKDLAGRIYEVYENGAKVGEESYVVDNPDDLPIPIGKRWNSHDRK